MKKNAISKLFLYRYRFIIGYIVLSVAFAVLLFTLPLISQTGLSQAEIDSATKSYYLAKDGILNGDLVNSPYHILQKISIMLFGLSSYAIKLPSIIIGMLLGFFLVLLLNRWFKSNVSLPTSCLIVLSTPFLYLSGSGTPLIMIVFWPTLLLWLGSKIHGEKKPRPIYVFAFSIAMLLSILTPYMIYFAVACAIFVLLQPHLRFILKTLPKLPFVIIALVVIAGLVALGINIARYPTILKELCLMPESNGSSFWNNLLGGLGLLFSWRGASGSNFLTPLISLPIFATALIGLFSTTKGFFASRNSIASLLVAFCMIIVGLNSSAIVFCILPLSILVAHGLKYILEKWYGLFPENPYARISAIFPLTLLFAWIIVPELLQYAYGYRYNPGLVNEFDYRLNIVKDNLKDETLVVDDNYEFYKILEHSTNIKVVNDIVDGGGDIAMMSAQKYSPGANYSLTKIITSPMKDNSDIIYLYTYIETGGEQNGSDYGPNEAD